MKVPSTALLRALSPSWAPFGRPWHARGCLAAQNLQQQARDFSRAQVLQARKKVGHKDKKITLIRYHLQHPRTPSPLRFSRLRALRHWTINRAWQLYQYRVRAAKASELQAQYTSMNRACEALRKIDSTGLTSEERLRFGIPEPLRDLSGKEKGSDEGRLYRIAMQKRGIWEGVPIEYARIQTETPSKAGWNHGWTR